MTTRKEEFHRLLRSSRKALRLTTDEVAALAGLDIELADNTRRNGGAWLRGLEAGKPATVDRATCSRLETALELKADELWTLLLLDPRKVDPEVRAYYESKMEPPDERRWREHAAKTHIDLQWWRTWARGLTGAHSETDQQMRDVIGASGGPWRERVARLADTHAAAGFDDAWLWRRALSHALESPALIVRALLGDRLGVDPRGKTLDQLAEMIEKAPA